MENCRNRRCELLSGPKGPVTIKQFDEQEYGLGYVIGDKDCYQQIYGLQAGCFQPDVRFLGEELGNPTDENNWGKCARRCKLDESCSFWSWSSSSCTNCKWKSCTIHGDNAVANSDQQFGIISGGSECQAFRSLSSTRRRSTTALASPLKLRWVNVRWQEMKYQAVLPSKSQATGSA